MSKRKINLEEILYSKIPEEIKLEGFSFGDVDSSSIINAMKEACRRVLELAAENARIIDDPNSYCGNTGSEYPPDQIVSAKSILSTINQVE